MVIDPSLDEYHRYLRRRGFAAKTIEAYLWVADYYGRNYGDVDEATLLEYRDWLVASYKPSTADQRVHAMNCYLTFLGREDLKLASIRVRQKTFIDRVIDFGGYRRLLNHLKSNEYARDYHAVRLLATTGVRVSELVSLEVGHMRDGYMDVVNKGRARRIHIPDAVANDALEWAEGEGRSSGRLLLNRYGGPITTRGISQQLKRRAAECGVDERLVYPPEFPPPVCEVLPRCWRRHRVPSRLAWPREHRDDQHLPATHAVGAARRAQPHRVLVSYLCGVDWMRGVPCRDTFVGVSA